MAWLSGIMTWYRPHTHARLQPLRGFWPALYFMVSLVVLILLKLYGPSKHNYAGFKGHLLRRGFFRRSTWIENHAVTPEDISGHNADKIMPRWM